jgi:pilus assembly protein CpaF
MTLVDRVVRRIVESDAPLDPVSVEAAARRGLAQESPLADPYDVQAVVDAVLGLGPLEPLLREPAVSDVLVDGSGRVHVERAGSLEPTDLVLDAGDVTIALARVLTPLGLRVDPASPTVDARLPDGSRLHAVVPPIAVDGPVVAIRRFTAAVSDLDELVASGSIRPDGASLLADAVADRNTILVTGGTGAGKTTLLNVLSHHIPTSERIVCLEDAPELQLAGHVVRLQTRPANVEGVGEVTLRSLVRSALRLRPDRIVIGEVRGPEALDLVGALNTGHDGSMSTLHANGPADGLLRLETLALSGDHTLRPASVRRQIRSALDLVVHVRRDRGARRVDSVTAVGERPAGDEVLYA